MELKEKVAIVTGGASGIGEAICRGMAGEGANVVVADIAVAQGQKVVEDLTAMGSKAMALKVDVTKSRDVDEMVRSVLNEFGKVDILVNNAGGSPPEKGVYFSDSKEEVWDWTIALNLKGSRNCARAVINHMMERKSGKIVSIASISGIMGTLTKADYSAAKAGIIALTKSLAKEVASYGINVNAVSPGPVETALFLSNTEEFKERLRKAIPMGRYASPEDVANMVVFLASDKADYITGQNFIVDGGKSLGS
jgi:NAD(P)-dependent dehydrogenase (short-subunit alcohol dehydrogenase family)